MYVNNGIYLLLLTVGRFLTDDTLRRYDDDKHFTLCWYVWNIGRSLGRSVYVDVGQSHLKDSQLLLKQRQTRRSLRRSSSSSMSAVVGDDIGYLVGCSKAVVLRRVKADCHVRPQYRVVGEAAVQLADKDQERYKGFQVDETTSCHIGSRQDRGFRRRSMLRELELV